MVVNPFGQLCVWGRRLTTKQLQPAVEDEVLSEIGSTDVLDGFAIIVGLFPLLILFRNCVRDIFGVGRLAAYGTDFCSFDQRRQRRVAFDQTQQSAASFQVSHRFTWIRTEDHFRSQRYNAEVTSIDDFHHRFDLKVRVKEYRFTQ